MALRATEIEVYFAVYNSSTGARVTDDAANLTMVVGKDGADPVAATNAPENHGNLHSLRLTAAEMTADCVAVDGTSATENAVVVPVVIITETAARAGDEMVASNMIEQPDLSALATLTALDDAEAAIIAAYQQAAGAGVNTVTVTLTDDNSDPCAGIWVKAVVGAQSFWAKTNTSGIATFLLDDGTYTFWPASSAIYTWGTGGSGYYTGVVSGDTALAFGATLQTIPASADPNLCACYLDIRALVGGAAIAEGTGWLQITQQTVPGFPEASSPGQAALARLDTTYTSDASGRITVEIVRGATVSLFAGVGAGPTGANTERRRAVNVVVPDAASYDLTQATWS